MQCFENRRYAEKDCTIVYASSCWKTYHTHTAFSTGAVGQLSFKCKTGIQRSRWQANNLPTLSSTSHWTLHGRGSGCWACFSFFFCQFLFQPTWRQFLLYKESTWIISFHYISHKATKSRPPVCADISEHVTHGSWNCNLHFDRMHFIFSCVISNRCLWVLISVPRSLLLLTWETDTFLNAYNCREQRTRPFDLFFQVSSGGSLAVQRYYSVFNINLCILFFKYEGSKNMSRCYLCWRPRVKTLLRIPAADFQLFPPRFQKIHK